MERSEGEHHCTEVLGRLQLAMLQRTKRQGRKHPHVEGLPEGPSQGDGQHGGREPAPGFLTKHDRGNSSKVPRLTTGYTTREQQTKVRNKKNTKRHGKLNKSNQQRPVRQHPADIW